LYAFDTSTGWPYQAAPGAQWLSNVHPVAIAHERDDRTGG
jgi:hypothetical protein